MDMNLYKPFGISTKDIIKEMSGIGIRGMDIFDGEEDEIASMGMASIITFAGAKKGRLLIDLEPNLALCMANNIMGEKYNNIKNQMVLSLVAEVNNIISGNAITEINNSYLMNLRLAPPVVFAGKDVVISIPKIKSLTSWGNTDYGRIRINIAWEGGSNEWT
jgi:chemotaxis protein CheX